MDTKKINQKTNNKINNKINQKIEKIKEEMKFLEELELEEKIEAINKLKIAIAEYTPFEEPVDVVLWVKAENVVANDYNPNRVAPPEMKLLKLSIEQDGFTQPIVGYKADGAVIIVDGFHRNRVGREEEKIRKRLHGYLPITVIDKPLRERMASTIRHNRARGTHQIGSMADLVAELHFMGWSDKKIAEQLGMEKDEVLRFKQFKGLGDLFKNRQFSKAWQ